ncbi:MAG TPA: patatin-like phospholipase family protein [Solirubrobacteraceae bacterium]|nr:patatin-like phospholipase family protein [Solirubrobacteraceae bacterium]
MGRKHKREHAPPPDSGLHELAPAERRWRNPPPRGVDYLVDGSRPEPVPAYRGPVEEAPADHCAAPVVGICCSGGGIRSAAYNLGALQALQQAGRLQSARYLAAVSGGSYIAAAFAMVRKTSTRGGRAGDDSDPSLIAAQPPFAPGSPEEQYLRNRSSYLAPDGMAKLFLGYRVLLGLVFNVLFISLPLLGVTMLLGVWAYRLAFPTLVGACHKECGHLVHLPVEAWILPAFVLSLSIVLGLRAMTHRFKSRRADMWLRIAQLWSTRLLVIAAAVAFVTIVLPELVSLVHECTRTRGSGGKGGVSCGTGTSPARPGTSTTATGTSTAAPIAGGVAGLSVLLAGILSHMRNLLGTGEEVAGKLKGLPVKAREALAYAAALLAGPALLIGVMVLTLSLTLRKAGTETARLWLSGVGAGALMLFGAFYFWTDLTALSLHPFYRRRLCTVFALKRVRPPVGPRTATTAEEREQGIAVERSYSELVKLSDTALPGEQWPTLLVCAAANVSDPGATPPGRRVTSFTFSAHTIGGPLIGGIETAVFEEALEGDRRRSRDLTLPAAVAMSGAAIAPSMGKQTRWPLTFLMALANIRLGVWLPNPRFVAKCQAQTRGKRILRSRPRPSYLLRELIGRNRVDAKYLFVTDGGHYENLGLVELLRRGCTHIYCFDASGGSTFAELGDAVALARSELGVEIAINPTPLEPRSAKTGGEEQPGEREVAERDVVTGTFTYRSGAKGRLVYARNVMTAQAPWDVKAHHRSQPAFPHDSTIDQLYTDQKFESYRALGQLAGEHALEQMGER